MAPSVAAYLPGTLAGTPFLGVPLDPAFDENLRLTAGSTRADDSTVVGTAPVWGYMAIVGRKQRAARGDCEALHVRLQVREGLVGLALLDESQTAYLAVTGGIAPGGVSDVTFLVRGIERVGPLVVLNAGAAPARFDWLGAESFELHPEFDALVTASVFSDEITAAPGWNRYYGSFAATQEEGIRSFFFEQLQRQIVMPWRRGLRVVITPGEETSRALFVSGEYEPVSMAALERFLSPGTVFLDVGANVGLYTLMGSRSVGPTGHVYSFEPSSRELAVLRRNVSISECPNVTVVPAAVADRMGTGTLHVAAGRHRGQNTLAPSFGYPGVDEEREEPVAIVCLDELYRVGDIRRPDVIKIDAEGSELQVFQGAKALLREAMPVVAFEVNDTLLRASGASPGAVADFLIALGYRLHRLDDDTGELVRVERLDDTPSENFLALPPAPQQLR